MLLAAADHMYDQHWPGGTLHVWPARAHAKVVAEHPGKTYATSSVHSTAQNASKMVSTTVCASTTSVSAETFCMCHQCLANQPSTLTCNG